MYRRISSLFASIVLMGSLSTLLAVAQVTSGQKVETKGMILLRDADTLTVDSRDLGKIVVVINDNTKVQTPKGIFRHNEMQVTSLIPGLDITLKGVGTDNGQILAEEIRFSKESLKIAQQAHAAMTATQAQAEANKQNIQENQKGIAANASEIDQHTEQIKTAEKRFDDLTEFDVKKELTLTFDTGKSTLSPDAQQQLTALASEAKGLKGYLISVRGFASTSGNAARNQELSDERANAVVVFLQQQGIALRHITTPAAMGITNPAAPNTTQEGREQNQRVEVKILVNKGLNQ